MENQNKNPVSTVISPSTTSQDTVADDFVAYAPLTEHSSDDQYFGDDVINQQAHNDGGVLMSEYEHQTENLPKVPDPEVVYAQSFQSSRTHKVSIVLAVAAILFIALLSGGVLVNNRLNQSLQQSPVAGIPDQPLIVSDQDLIAGASVDGQSLPGQSDKTLIVNGDITMSGGLYVQGGTYFAEIRSDELSVDRQYSLPDQSGEICLSTNNCDFAQNGQVVSNIAGTTGAILLGQGLALQNGTLSATQNNVAATTINGNSGGFNLGNGLLLDGQTISSSFQQTRINNLLGSVTLQGTPNRVNVSTSGNIVTVTTPQDIAMTSSAPTFQSISLIGAGTQNGNTLCDSSNNCGFTTATNAFLQGGNSFGCSCKCWAPMMIMTLSLETNNTTRLTLDTAGNATLAGGQFIIQGDGNPTAAYLFNYESTANTGMYLLSGDGESGLRFDTDGIEKLRVHSYGIFASASTTITGGTTGNPDALTVNNSTSTGNILNLQDNGTNVLTVADGGAVTLQNTTNSTTALRVLNAAGDTTILSVDTTNNRVGIGTASPTNTLSVSGDANISGKLAVGNYTNSVNNCAIFGAWWNSPDCEVYFSNQNTTTNATDIYVVNSMNSLLVDPSADASNTYYYGTTGEVFSASANSQDIGALVGGYFTAKHRGSGTAYVNGLIGQAVNYGSGDDLSVVGLWGLAYQNGSGSTVTDAIGVAAGVTRWAGTLTNAYGLRIQSSSGAITNNYGIQVQAQSSGTNNYGIAIGSASTQTLWVNSTSNSTNAAGGIGFGSSRDTNLYRSASGELTTDDDFVVGSQLAVGTSIDANTTLNVASTNTATSGTYYGQLNTFTLDAVSASSAEFNGSGTLIIIQSDQNYTNIVRGEGTVIQYQGNGTVSNASALNGVVSNTGSGTITLAEGTGGRLYNLSDGSIGTGTALLGQIINAGTGSMGTVAGLDISSALNVGGGSINTMYGIIVRPQTAATNNYGIAVGSASTQTLWVNNTSDSTTAAGGIAFGSSRDTTLYRSAAGTLRVGSNMEVADKLQVGSTNPIGTCNGILSLVDCSIGLRVENSVTNTTNVTQGITSRTTVSATTAANGQSNIGTTNIVTLTGTEDFTGINGAMYNFAQSDSSGVTNALYGSYSTVAATAGTVNLAVGAGVGAGTVLGLATGSIDTFAGFYVVNPSTQLNISNSYGMQIESMNSATNNYGIAIGSASTQTLWVNSTSNSTNAAGGIAFGSSRDTTLYRSAAGQLTMNGQLIASTSLTSPLLSSSGATVLGVDTGGAAGLEIGVTNANAVTISRVGVLTTIQGSLVVNQASTFQDTVTVNGHIISGNSSGSTVIAANAAACTTPSVSVSGNDTAGTITVTTGTGCASAGILATITFANAYGSAPRVVMTPTTADSAGLTYYNGSTTTTGFTLDTATIPTDSTSYIYNYHVIQ
jgi:hypothetical protein